jgi:hypothetical protein
VRMLLQGAASIAHLWREIGAMAVEERVAS